VAPPVEPIKASPTKAGKADAPKAGATSANAKVENFGETGLNLIIKQRNSMIDNSLHKAFTMDPSHLEGLDGQNSEMFDNTMANPDNDEDIFEEV
jgi:hypothetical protein